MIFLSIFTTFFFITRIINPPEKKQESIHRTPPPHQTVKKKKQNNPTDSKNKNNELISYFNSIIDFFFFFFFPYFDTIVVSHTPGTRTSCKHPRYVVPFFRIHAPCPTFHEWIAFAYVFLFRKDSIRRGETAFVITHYHGKIKTIPK